MKFWVQFLTHTARATVRLTIASTRQPRPFGVSVSFFSIAISRFHAASASLLSAFCQWQSLVPNLGSGAKRWHTSYGHGIANMEGEYFKAGGRMMRNLWITLSGRPRMYIDGMSIWALIFYMCESYRGFSTWRSKSAAISQGQLRAQDRLLRQLWHGATTSVADLQVCLGK